MSEESKAATFQRLAVRRTQSALDKLGLIGNLGSSQYESTEEQRSKIVLVLANAVADIEKRLNGAKSGKEPFTL